MPIYEYSCNSCGNDFEKLTSFSDTATPACPTCDSTAVARQLGRPAIHFKGSGWYITDSKSSSKESANGGKVNAKENGSDNGSDNGTGSSSDNGTSSGKEIPADSKTPAKSETKSSDSAPASKVERAMAAD